jgi:plastocyanin
VTGRDRRKRVAWATAALLAATGCGEGVVYPGRADVREGDPPEIRVGTEGGDATDPGELTVPAGTEVTWLNHTTGFAHVRFEDDIPEVCADPHDFHRTEDDRTYVSRPLPPFAEARLCVSRPGRYRFIVTLAGTPGGEHPARYGTLIVVP